MMKKDQREQARRSLAKVTDYQRVFGSSQGKRVLYDLMKTHFMLSGTMGRDPYESAAREGERQVVIRILSKLSKDIKELENYIMEADKNAYEDLF